MKKKPLQINVYEALQQRLKLVFEEFDNILISFSGGKDSSLLLNLVMDFQKKHYPDRRIGVFHQDFEAQYTVTTEYVERTFARIRHDAELYWVCLPMATRTALSSYEMYWYPWDDRQPDLWVRPMPQHEYVINLQNNPITTYRYRMHQEDLAKQFCRWYRMAHGGGRTVCLLGLRTDESLHRYGSVAFKKYDYKGQSWITSMFKEVYCASPLYDWSISDVWHAYALFGYDYNRIYDLYYMAGLSPAQMRVASPFNDYSKESLNLYRVIDPAIWSKLVGRVQGANFAALYSRTRAMGFRNVKLPDGYTWREYTTFLLRTLPQRLQKNYISKFRTSIDFWQNVGGGLDENVILELLQKGYNIRCNGLSGYTRRPKRRVVFVGEIPDHTDDILLTRDIPSWKRMCACILKNDHTCRFMGFSPTREQQRTIRQIQDKYAAFMDAEEEDT